MKITEPLLCGSECSGTDGFRDSSKAAAASAAVVLFESAWKKQALLLI